LISLSLNCRTSRAGDTAQETKKINIRAALSSEALRR
jgi:hypothetical protein